MGLACTYWMVWAAIDPSMWRFMMKLWSFLPLTMWLIVMNSKNKKTMVFLSEWKTTAQVANPKDFQTSLGFASTENCNVILELKIQVDLAESLKLVRKNNIQMHKWYSEDRGIYVSGSNSVPDVWFQIMDDWLDPIKTMSLVRYTVSFWLQEAHIQMRERENGHVKSRVCSQWLFHLDPQSHQHKTRHSIPPRRARWLQFLPVSNHYGVQSLPWHNHIPAISLCTSQVNWPV